MRLTQPRLTRTSAPDRACHAGLSRPAAVGARTTLAGMAHTEHEGQRRRLRRDRHGRGMRGPFAWPRVPVMSSRSDQFDEQVLDAVERIERRIRRPLEDVEFAVELVPPSDPAPWEHRQVPLSRLFPAEGKLPARIVLYRRPIETRAEDPRDLPAMINDIVIEQLAGALNVEPTTLDPDYRRDD